MKKSILTPIIGGIFLGGILFATGPLLPIVFLLKFIFTPFGMGRSRFGRQGYGGPGFGGPMGFNPQMRFAMADKVRGMSEEDYTNFKTKFDGRFNGSCNVVKTNNSENTTK